MYKTTISCVKIHILCSMSIPTCKPEHEYSTVEVVNDVLKYCMSVRSISTHYAYRSICYKLFLEVF